MCNPVEAILNVAGDVVRLVTDPVLDGLGLGPPDMSGLEDAMEEAAAANQEIAAATMAAVQAQAHQMERVIGQMRRQAEASQKALEKQIADQEAARQEEEAQLEMKKQRRLRNMTQGRKSTILTGGMGLTEEPEVSRAKLLGGGA